MNPVCEMCQGACCESFVVSLPDNAEVDVIRWLGLRGTVTHGALRLDVPCRELTTEGTCGIWKNRPKPCHDYEVGGISCRRAIAARRPSTSDAIFAKLSEWSSPQTGCSPSASSDGASS